MAENLQSLSNSLNPQVDAERKEGIHLYLQTQKYGHLKRTVFR